MGRRENRQRKILPEFTSERHEGVKMLNTSCIRDLDNKGMSLSGKASAATLRDFGEKHAVSKFRRAVRVKITTEDKKRGNMLAEFEREKIISESKRTGEMGFRLRSVQMSCVRGGPPHVRCIFHSRAKKDSVYG